MRRFVKKVISVSNAGLHSDSYASPRFIQYVLAYAGVLRVFGQDNVAHVNGVHEPFRLHVVKGQLITC